MSYEGPSPYPQPDAHPRRHRSAINRSHPPRIEGRQNTVGKLSEAQKAAFISKWIGAAEEKEGKHFKDMTPMERNAALLSNPDPWHRRACLSLLSPEEHAGMIAAMAPADAGNAINDLSNEEVMLTLSLSLSLSL